MDQDEVKIEGVLNKLASSLIKIDLEHPDFGIPLPAESEGHPDNFGDEIQEEIKDLNEPDLVPRVCDGLKNFY